MGALRAAELGQPATKTLFGQPKVAVGVARRGTRPSSNSTSLFDVVFGETEIPTEVVDHDHRFGLGPIGA